MNNKNLITSFALIAVFCIAAFALFKNSATNTIVANNTSITVPPIDSITTSTSTIATSTKPIVDVKKPVVVPISNPKPPVVPPSTTTYKNGTYSAIGNYGSPGGSETINVELTFSNDVITSANVISNATRPASINWQEAFISGYKPFVVGKKIDEVILTKVSGSSLTPKGFNEALAEIKVQAHS